MSTLPSGESLANTSSVQLIPTSSRPSAPRTEVELTDSLVYREILQLRPIEAVPSTHDLVVHSQLDTSRHPDAKHVRYRVAIDIAGLERLHRSLGRYLNDLSQASATEVQSNSGARA